MSVLVPIAHRLGINSIKSELENLSLYYLKPDVYNDILEKLNLHDEILDFHTNLINNLLNSEISDETIKKKDALEASFFFMPYRRRLSDSRRIPQSP